MQALLVVLNVVGALGVFLFGMKIMSEALQKVAGDRLKTLLDSLTRNRVSGVFTGFLMTTVVQSSSATTVMVISFVGAGLLSLTSAIGVIMGANIGTTVTGWLVALLGFKVKVTSFALPAIGLGMGLRFMKGNKAKQWGEVVLGFGLLFLGLGLMKDAVPVFTADQLSWVSGLSTHGLLSTVLFVGVGTVLTIVLQSSSATMTLTLTLTAAGVIPYPAAAAMILGENIGTTATANVAAIGGTAAARRAARAHFVFNIIGATWAILVLQLVLLPIVDNIVPGDPTAGVAITVTAHLAAVHSLFNVTNTLVMLPFVTQIATLVTWWVPDDAESDGPRFSRFPSTTIAMTPELFLVQAREEMACMTELARRMCIDALHLMGNPQGNLGSLVEDTQRHEDRIDGLDREITDALALVAQATISASASRRIAEMSLNTHRVERIGDHCEKLVEIAIMNHKAGDQGMGDAALEDIRQLGALVLESLVQLQAYISGDSNAAAAAAIEAQINDKRDELRVRYVARIESGDVRPVPVLWLLNAVAHLEEIGDRAYGIVKRTEATRRL